MADARKILASIGRANTVLVFGHGNGAKAAITTVVAHVRDKESGERVRFVGPAIFEKKAAQHIVEVVLPAANGVLRALNLPERCFDISVVNLDATSIMDVGLNISGYSADVPILLAILSASLQMAVPEDIVSTGHIASPDGDIRMVKNMPAKLEAVIKARSIGRFIHPAMAEESPLDPISGGEKQGAADALARAKQGIRTIPVRDIGELVREVFWAEQAVLASLRQGFYMLPVPSTAETGVGKTAQFLAQDNEKRFWTALEHQLLQARNNDSRDLLLALAQFHIERKIYPEGLGQSLLRLVQSLPPQTRRLKLKFPLLPMSEYIHLSQYAKDPDHEDVRLLLRANFDEKPWQAASVDNPNEPNNHAGSDHDKTLQIILSEISAETLTDRIGLPIDSARAAYMMDSVTVNSHEEFSGTVASFYLHLMRHHTRKISEPADLEAAGAEAFALLERTFSKRGGLRAALAEARSGLQGGLRLVFDMMTEQFKREEQEKYINGVLKSALDPLDWKGKVSLMGTLMKRLEVHLNPEIGSQPPERFAEHYEAIIRAYLESMEGVNSIFRSL